MVPRFRPFSRPDLGTLDRSSNSKCEHGYRCCDLGPSLAQAPASNVGFVDFNMIWTCPIMSGDIHASAHHNRKKKNLPSKIGNHTR